MQKCVGFDNFKAIGFLYLGDKSNPDPAAFISGILEGVVKVSFSSILIPYSSHLGQFSDVLPLLIEEMSKFEAIKQISLTTNNGKDFKEGAKYFVKAMMKFID